MSGLGTLISGNGGIIYTGNFKNGFKWGKGKIEDNINQFTFEGSFVQNKIEGLGSKIDHREGTKYSGSFIDGEKSGQGNCLYPNGNRFKGMWKSDLPNQGELFLRTGDRMFGEWKDDRFSGAGSIQYFNGNRYEGEWRMNLPHGFGMMKFQDGSVYSG
jgi:hypothetical protein